uniref:Polyprotein n=1 Tax=Peronospora matthiolae TaxID=2874970 RepID=A0AAV1V845_9STRA
MKAELVVPSEVAREMLGLREMINEIGTALEMPMVMRIDNQAAIRHLEGEISSLKAKHIDVRVKFVCDFARRRIVIV